MNENLKIFKIKLFFMLWQITCETTNETFSTYGHESHISDFPYLLYMYFSKEGLDLAREMFIFQQVAGYCY